MQKYLINNVLTFRVPTVEDALKLREELQNTDYAELVNFSYTTKYIKAKGEIIEEYQLVKAKLEFNAEKDPEKLSLANSSDEEDYAVGVVVNAKDKDTEWAKDIANAYRSDDIRTYIEETYEGVFRALF